MQLSYLRNDYAQRENDCLYGGQNENREEYKTYRNGKFSNMKLAVLMDDWSASARKYWQELCRTMIWAL